MQILNQVIKFIPGKNLYLRPVLKSDFEVLIGWMNDREVLQFLTMYLPMTEKMEMEWIEKRSINENNIVLAIVLNDNTLIGTIGIHNIKWKDQTATSGCCIGRKECWGKGFGTEAKMLMLHYVFYELNLRKINSFVFSNNPRSLAYQKKCGGKVEGVMKKQVYHDGKYLNQISMAVFKEDFKRIWEKEKHKFL